MPVMNGHEATRAIRKVEAARRAASGGSVTSAASTPGSEVPPTHNSPLKAPHASTSLHKSPASEASESGSGSGSGSSAAGLGSIKLPPVKVLQTRSKIFALTGLATADDKREAFSSGVDG